MMYIRKRTLSDRTLELDLFFPEIKNLVCKSHKEEPDHSIRGIKLKDYVIVVFEKQLLSKETLLGEFRIDCE